MVKCLKCSALKKSLNLGLCSICYQHQKRLEGNRSQWAVSGHSIVQERKKKRQSPFVVGFAAVTKLGKRIQES